MISLQNYLKLKQKLDKFCTAPTNTWKMRFLLESMDDMEFYHLITSVLNQLKTIGSVDLDNLFLDIRGKANIHVEEFKKVDVNNVEEQYQQYLKIERYYGLIEQIDELSAFSDSITYKLVTKYGNEFMMKLDQDNPSQLTDFHLSFKNVKYDDDLIHIYLVLKKWQDLQHIFARDILHGLCQNDKLESYIKEKCQYHTNARISYELHKINKKEYLSMYEISMYIASGIDKKIIPLIGGKGYGLGCLNIYSKIPETYVVLIHKSPQSLLKVLDKKKKYAVRSSADLEDGQISSFAGMFQSYLNVEYKDINNMFERVIQSINNPRIQSYIKEKQLNQPQMAVIIQEYIEPTKAGVFLGRSINSGIYEYVEGNASKLVDGSVTPIQVAQKDDLTNQFIKLQKKLNVIADFEWCIVHDELIMIQYRPVTSMISKKISRKDGIGVSDGIVSGNISFIEQESNFSSFKADTILLTFLTDPNWVPLMMKSKRIITAIGGYLSHTAIIARELGIPCITDIGIEKLLELKNCEHITMNGKTGEIIGINCRNK